DHSSGPGILRLRREGYPLPLPVSAGKFLVCCTLAWLVSSIYFILFDLFAESSKQRAYGRVFVSSRNFMPLLGDSKLKGLNWGTQFRVPGRLLSLGMRRGD